MLPRLVGVFALFLCLLLAPAAQAFSPTWNLINEEAGVKVYRSETREAGKLFAFKGETTYTAPVAKVLYVLLDNEHRVEWVGRLAYSEVLEQKNDHEYVLYQHFALPAVFADRDYVYYGKATMDEAGVVTLHIQSIDYPGAPESVGVRADLIDSRYVLTPLPEGGTKIEVEIITDPKGWMPAWLTNSIQESWPIDTLNGIRTQLEQPYTGEYPLPPR